MVFRTKPAPSVTLPQNGPGRVLRPAVPTIISADMVVEGNLKTAGDVQVEGQIIGHIEAGRLVVAESGVVIGNVTAANARICGTLNGSVHGGTITLTATAKVTGDLHHDVLAIEAGGMLEGLSRRRVAKPAELAAPVAVVEAQAAE